MRWRRDPMLGVPSFSKVLYYCKTVLLPLGVTFNSWITGFAVRHDHSNSRRESIFSRFI